MEENPKKKNSKKIKKQNHKNIWPYIVLVLAIALSFCFSILSEIVLGATGLIIAMIVIIVFVGISIIFDMIGVAIAACDKEPFMAMASKKVRGAKESLMLIRNADKVASLCADVVGDVCGILSGAAGASIVAKIAMDTSNTFLCIFVASLIASLIAGVTIFGKALGKRRAMDNCSAIILRVGKILSIFTKQSKQKKKEHKNKHEATESVNTDESVDKNKQ